jgi:hypothetical protein
MITLGDLRYVISYGEHTVMLTIDEKHDIALLVCRNN